MNDNKLICPVKRINKSSFDCKIDLDDDKMKINVDIITKNPVKYAIDFFNNKFNKEKE